MRKKKKSRSNKSQRIPIRPESQFNTSDLKRYNSELIFLLGDIGYSKKNQPSINLEIVTYYCISAVAFLRANGLRNALLAFEFKRVNGMRKFTIHLLFMNLGITMKSGEWFFS